MSAVFLKAKECLKKLVIPGFFSRLNIRIALTPQKEIQKKNLQLFKNINSKENFKGLIHNCLRACRNLDG